MEAPAPSPQETWDALFSEFYLRAYADEEADADAGAQAPAGGAAGGLPAGGDLLDVPCGYGRHSIPLARAGYRVTGVDSSPTLLAEARRRVGDPAPDPRRGRLPRAALRRHSFDAALNLFTSLGFHGDEEDAKALADIGRVLRPSGRLVIETMHRDLAVRGFREQDWRLLGEGRLLLEQRTFDAAAGIAQTTQTLIDKDGGRDSRTFSVRVYTATELVAMLGRAGFGDVRCYGDLDGGPFDTTTRLVIVARGRVSAVRIVPWGDGDLALLEQLVGDPAMMEHLGGAESAEKIAERQVRYELADSGMFKIVDAIDGRGRRVGRLLGARMARRAGL